MLFLHIWLIVYELSPLTSLTLSLHRLYTNDDDDDDADDDDTDDDTDDNHDDDDTDDDNDHKNDSYTAAGAAPDAGALQNICLGGRLKKQAAPDRLFWSS